MEPMFSLPFLVAGAPHVVALVRAGAKFEKGVMVERPKEQDQEAAA